MKMKNAKITIVLATALALATLAGCGGGGGGSSPSSPTVATAAPQAPAPAPVASASAPAPTTNPTNPDLVTSVTPPTYTAGSTEKGGWDVLERERQACGFGLLQQDTRLDVAAAAHAHYLAQLSVDRSVDFTGHGETVSDPYFTGSNSFDRAIAAGFPPSTPFIGEILTATTSLHSTTSPDQFLMNETQGAASVRVLLATVYHLSGALTAGRVGGVGADHRSGPYAATQGYTLEAYRFGALVAVVDKPQVLGSGIIASYPCAGATAVSGTFIPAEESPNPFPEIKSTTVVYGTPIYFKADASSVLSVTAATVTKVSDGTVLALRQLTKANDPATEIGANEVFLVPTTPLAAGSSYTVAATGTLNGTAFTKTFTFTPSP